MSEVKLPTLIDDLAELEQVIESARKKASHVHHRMMRELDEEDGDAKPNLALLEIGLRALAQSRDAVRYSRHATKGEAK